MWGFAHRTARGVVACAAGLVLGAVPTMAQQKPPQPAAQQKPPQPAAVAEPSPTDVCYGLTGADAATKVNACSDAIAKGTLNGGALALAYLNRGLSESGPDSDKRSKADYRQAIKIFNDAIVASPLNPQLYIHRGIVHQTIGEADRAILDYSDAMRLAPKETLPLINRGIVLYTKKDNNEGAIADFNAALKLDPREITAYINRGIVYRRKGELDKAIQDFTTAIKLLPEKIEPVQVKLVPDSTTSQLAPTATC